MNRVFQLARRIKNSSPLLQRLWARSIDLRRRYSRYAYAEKLAREALVYRDIVDVNALPAIFDYWSNKYLVPLHAQFGFANPDEFFAKYLRESALACEADDPRFVSIGSGNCDTEVRVAKLLIDTGLTRFTFECLDLNGPMLARGRELAEREGVLAHFEFVVADFNSWQAARCYQGAMASQSLHHVVNLEGLFDEIRHALQPRALFAISDIIGCNGHRRWPEALREVRRFWKELPETYRYNRQLQRYEHVFENWDCSHEAFEGIRAQDILPLLLERFDFYVYVGFANVIDVFVDRSFGHNFDATQEWDRAFIDRVHAFDEQALRSGALTPTHMMAVLTLVPPAQRHYARGLSPQRSVRSGVRR